MGVAAAANGASAAPRPLASMSGRSIAIMHAVIVYMAFVGALAIGCSLHYVKLVKNAHYGYPIEWFPSISATIGDWFPERSYFHYFMAAASTPRFAIVFLAYFMLRAEPKLSKALNYFIFIVGLLRVFAAGGWTYVTSEDHWTFHTGAMIVYLLCSLIYQIGYCRLLYLAKRAATGTISDKDWAMVRNKIVFICFFIGVIPFLIYLFIEHDVKHTPGAYSMYACFEWSVVLIDVGFDLTAMNELAPLQLVVVDTSPVVASSAAAGSSSAAAAAFEKTDPIHLQSSPIAIKEFIVDTYLAFITWSMFTAVGTMIWYFPLFNMSLSGEEATIVASLAPALLSLPGLLYLSQNAQALLQLLSFIGIACYTVPEPPMRLLLGGVGLAINLLVVVASWYQAPIRRNRSIVTFMLGLLLSLIVRVWATTINPLWPVMNVNNGGMQVPALIVAVVCVIDVLFRTSPPTYTRPKNASGSGVAAGLGFGALLYLTHMLFTETATLSRFIWAEYPNPGPEPFPHGLLVLVAMMAGILLSTVGSLTKSAFFWAVGALGCAVLYYSDRWIAYSGGLVLCVYVISIWPVMISAVAQHAPIVSVGVGFLIDVILFFAHAWVIAYAFVPYGEVTRERTDVLLGVVMMLILVGVVFGEGEALFEVPKATDAGKKAKEAVQAAAATAKKFYSKEFTRVLLILLLLAGAAAGAAYTRMHPPYTYKVLGQKNGEKVVTGGIWTIHFGYDNAMWASHHRMVQLINDTKVDFVGLLESDAMRMFAGNRDIPLMVAEKLNMYVEYGPPAREHSWGCALLSKFPIKWSRNYLLPSPDGELACAIHATLDVNGTDLDVVIAHNGQEETPLDRKLQSQLEGQILLNATNPIIFAGYVVTKPHADVYNWLVKDGNAKDIDPTDHDRWCQYIVYKNLERLGYARISHGGVTDTEMQIARFRLNTDTDNDEEIDEKLVPKEYRFSAKFKGEGVRGHRFHVFDRPKYFGKKTA